MRGLRGLWERFGELVDRIEGDDAAAAGIHEHESLRVLVLIGICRLRQRLRGLGDGHDAVFLALLAILANYLLRALREAVESAAAVLLPLLLCAGEDLGDGDNVLSLYHR